MGETRGPGTRSPGLWPAELSDWICSGPEGGRGEGQGPDKELEAPIPDFMLTPQATRVPFSWSTRPFPDFHGCPQGLAAVFELAMNFAATALLPSGRPSPLQTSG